MRGLAAKSNYPTVTTAANLVKAFEECFLQGYGNDGGIKVIDYDEKLIKVTTSVACCQRRGNPRDSRHYLFVQTH